MDGRFLNGSGGGAVAETMSEGFTNSNSASCNRATTPLTPLQPDRYLERPEESNLARR